MLHYLLRAVFVSAIVAVIAPVAATAEEAEPAKLLLLLDSSGSMAGPDSAGVPKIDAAKSALRTVVGSRGDQERVGLRVFGAKEVPESPPACTDSQLEVPIGSANKNELRTAVHRYQPRGETPIAYALEQAATDFTGEGRRTILLVSDGIATCDRDPCEVAARIAAAGVDLTVHVVGFGVDTPARQQLRCIADKSSGTYYDANDTETLTAALDRVATRAFRPFTVSGTPVRGTSNSHGAPELKSGGQYTDALGAEKSARHYLVRRERAGSSVHVGLSMIPRHNLKGQVGVKIRTVAGEDCGFDYANTNAGGPSESWHLITAQAVAWPKNSHKNNRCRDDKTLVVTIEMTDWLAEIAGTPYELVVREEPAVNGAEQLPAPADAPAWQAITVNPSRQQVVGGASFNDAAALEPGKSYNTDILPGESVFFRVPVTWGQTLQAEATFPTPNPALAKALGTISPTVKLTPVSPMRGDVNQVFLTGGERYSNSIRKDVTTRLTAASATVRWRNRQGGDKVQHACLDGDYYLVVSMDRKDGATFVVPFTLTVAAVGSHSGAPKYAETPTSAAPTAQVTPRNDTEESTRRSPLVIGAIAGMVVALLGVGAGVVWHRRRVR